MRFFGVALLLAVVATVAYSEVVNGNGQPGCKTAKELVIGVFRNNWDPTRYWKCTALNKTAIAVRCPEETGWSDSEKRCIPWIDWVWVAPTAPLSEPDVE